jgi:4-nitrophenyl phosphatase
MVSSEDVPKKLATVDEYKTFLDKFDTFLLDCDGSLSSFHALLAG